MNKHTLIVVALVIGSSSVALADSSFSIRARGSASFGYNTPTVTVRDHRTPTRTPSYQAPRYQAPEVRYTPSNVRRYERPTAPVLVAPIECRNWDPSVEITSACTYYSTGYASLPAVSAGWSLLGARESAVPDNQFVTVGPGRTFSQLKITAETASPTITKIAIRFMDDSVQVVSGAQLHCGASIRLYLDGGRRQINQIVVYTATGSQGTYSIAAL